MRARRRFLEHGFFMLYLFSAGREKDHETVVAEHRRKIARLGEEFADRSKHGFLHVENASLGVLALAAHLLADLQGETAELVKVDGDGNVMPGAVVTVFGHARQEQRFVADAGDEGADVLNEVLQRALAIDRIGVQLALAQQQFDLPLHDRGERSHFFRISGDGHGASDLAVHALNGRRHAGQRASELMRLPLAGASALSAGDDGERRFVKLFKTVRVAGTDDNAFRIGDDHVEIDGRSDGSGNFLGAFAQQDISL